MGRLRSVTPQDGRIWAAPGTLVGLVLVVVLMVAGGCGGDAGSASQADETSGATTETTVQQGSGGTESGTGAVDPALAENTRRFIGLAAEGDFAGATAMFDEQMSAALTSDQLAELWTSLQGQVGAFQGVTGLEQTTEQGYRVVYATTDFAQSAVRIKVVFGADGRISGLFFLPAEGGTGETDSSAYAPPAYADQTSFREEEVQTGAEGWPLPATLTLPVGEGPFPAVVLVHGSGAHDRNESLGPNRPFQDLAWGLASRGVAVLRYEKRSKEHATRLAGSTDITVDDVTVDDAVASLALLAARPEVDSSAVYVLGHSLGATMAPRIAADAVAAGTTPAGLVLLAAASRPLEQLVLDQVTYLANSDGTVTSDEQQAIDELQASAERVARGDYADDTPPGELPLQLPPAFWRSLEGYDPVAVAKDLDLPLLVLQGGRDYQVTEPDLVRWQEGLSGDANAQVEVFPSLNHLFMPGEGAPNPQEYQEPGHVDQQVIEAIASFITGR